MLLKKILNFNYCCLTGLIAFFYSSCKIPKAITQKEHLYFQNGLDSIKKIQLVEPVIHINDLLSVQVSSGSLNQEQIVPFNPIASPSGNQGYLVNFSGNIEMPVLGNVKAAGLTQSQLIASIIEKLIGYVKDPTVIVHFLQFKVNVLGEVNSPGVKKFDVDRVSIIDAISASGDLTDRGKRQDIAVIREEGSVRKIYKIDIRSGSIFQSPAYILQSNDIVYVGANFQKFEDFKKASKNEDAVRGLQVFGTIIGLLTSIIFAIQVLK